jgi:hypothetical protein
MMKLETTNSRDWQGFTRILEVMAFVDDIEDRSEEEVRSAVEQFCQLPANPGQTMSLEEVVFWAGVACGMEFCRQAREQADPDSGPAARMLVFASLFAHSMKNAIVDLAIGELEPQAREPWRDLGVRFRP